MTAFKSIIVCLALAISALTQNQPTVTIIDTFPPSMNGNILSQLMQGGGGIFYGVTQDGGNNGMGTIFRMPPQGGLKILFSFDGVRGAQPSGPLVQGRDGYFYGMTYQGGANGTGTIFKMSLAGAVQTLHSFCPQESCADGVFPNPALIRGLDGSYYGTTAYLDRSVAYRIGPNGTYVVLHRFNHPQRGLGVPSGSLVQASDGNLYGVSSRIGGDYRRGTIFMVTPQGQARLVYSFGELTTDGWRPAGSLIQAADGDLYGATIRGGANDSGVVFKISLQGSYQKIYDFPAGSYALGPPIQASDGSLWVNSHAERLYAITTSGSLLQDLDMYSLYGFYPMSVLMQGADGRLYGGGTTSKVPRGTNLIYALDAGLPPPAPSIAGFTPASGAVGTKVVVSGAYYVGATAVTFNGVSAGFVVNAAGVISAIVPEGASSGPIQVTNLGGTVASQNDFTVTP